MCDKHRAVGLSRGAARCGTLDLQQTRAVRVEIASKLSHGHEEKTTPVLKGYFLPRALFPHRFGSTEPCTFPLLSRVPCTAPASLRRDFDGKLFEQELCLFSVRVKWHALASNCRNNVQLKPINFTRPTVADLNFVF